MIRAVVYNQILDILAYWDLARLIESGAPYDEYAPEADSITSFVINNQPKITTYILADRIQLIFLRMELIFPDMQDCIAIAHEILDFIQ